MRWKLKHHPVTLTLIVWEVRARLKILAKLVPTKLFDLADNGVRNIWDHCQAWNYLQPTIAFKAYATILFSKFFKRKIGFDAWEAIGFSPWFDITPADASKTIHSPDKTYKTQSPQYLLGEIPPASTIVESMPMRSFHRKDSRRTTRKCLLLAVSMAWAKNTGESIFVTSVEPQGRNLRKRSLPQAKETLRTHQTRKIVLDDENDEMTTSEPTYIPTFFPTSNYKNQKWLSNEVLIE